MKRSRTLMLPFAGTTHRLGTTLPVGYTAGNYAPSNKTMELEK